MSRPTRPTKNPGSSGGADGGADPIVTRGDLPAARRGGPRSPEMGGINNFGIQIMARVLAPERRKRRTATGKRAPGPDRTRVNLEWINLLEGIPAIRRGALGEAEAAATGPLTVIGVRLIMRTEDGPMRSISLSPVFGGLGIRLSARDDATLSIVPEADGTVRVLVIPPGASLIDANVVQPPAGASAGAPAGAGE